MASCGLCGTDPKTGQAVINAGCPTHGVNSANEELTAAEKRQAERDSERPW